MRGAVEYRQRTGIDGLSLSPMQLAFGLKVLEGREKEKMRELGQVVQLAVAGANGAKVDWGKL